MYIIYHGIAELRGKDWYYTKPPVEHVRFDVFEDMFYYWSGIRASAEKASEELPEWSKAKVFQLYKLEDGDTLSFMSMIRKGVA